MKSASLVTAILSAGMALATEPVMVLPFDGSFDAVKAPSNVQPLRAERVTFAPGRHGQAARFVRADKSVLEYAFDGNLSRERGAVSMWFKSTKPDGRTYRDRLFSTSCPFVQSTRLGTGALYFWILDDGDGVLMRADASDKGDSYTDGAWAADSQWHHAVFSWDRACGTCVLLDGRTVCDSRFPRTDGWAPFRDVFDGASDTKFPRFGADGTFRSFFLGSLFGGEGFDGLIDDVKLYDRPVYEDDEIAPEERCRTPDYETLSDGCNPYVGESLSRAGVPGEKTLVHEIRFERLPSPLACVGECRLGRCGDVSYLEAGTNENDRFAVPLDLDESVSFYIVEIDYPDDRIRTMDILLQDARHPKSDYAMGVGVMCGGEYVCTGRIRTHRCVFWKRSGASALAVMTARAGQPAAVSAVRLYKATDGKLPAARLVGTATKGGLGRMVGVYYEDAAVNYDFGVKDSGGTPAGEVDLARRLAATMKYTGQNLLAHPGVFYNGPIDERYRPRTFAPSFLQAFYSVFDREGLFVMPTVNWHNLFGSATNMTPELVACGGLHDSIFAVQGDEVYPRRREMRRGSLYNFCHPEVQRHILEAVDRLVADGRRHPSFKGLVVHLKYPSLCWFGTLESGYNDSCVAAFENATGIRVPVDRKDPRRGKAYYAWLMGHAKETWIRWRCELVTGFWIDVANRLKAVRPDLKLWMQHVTMLDPIVKDGRLLRKDYLYETAREGGFDPELFSRRTTNGMLGMMTVPADWRWAVRHRSWYPTEADRLRQKDMHFEAETWDFVRSSPYPVADVHDRYWEEACGRGKATLTCDWMRELSWRVGTINAPGRDALEHFAAPLRTCDILGITKGGWMIGTYGMEDVLAPFAQAFRALPPVVMRDVSARVGTDALVRVRETTYEGVHWLYAVNTGATTAKAEIDFETGHVDVVSGETCRGVRLLRLEPYELRSYRTVNHPMKEQDK